MIALSLVLFQKSGIKLVTDELCFTGYVQTLPSQPHRYGFIHRTTFACISHFCGVIFFSFWNFHFIISIFVSYASIFRVRVQDWLMSHVVAVGGRRTGFRLSGATCVLCTDLSYYRGKVKPLLGEGPSSRYATSHSLPGESLTRRRVSGDLVCFQFFLSDSGVMTVCCFHIITPFN